MQGKTWIIVKDADGHHFVADSKWREHYQQAEDFSVTEGTYDTRDSARATIHKLNQRS
jgi:hypothetical protein